MAKKDDEAAEAAPAEAAAADTPAEAAAADTPADATEVLILPKSCLIYGGVLHARSGGPIAVTPEFAAAAREAGLLDADEAEIQP